MTSASYCVQPGELADVITQPSMLQALVVHPDFAVTDRSRVTCVMTGASEVPAVAQSFGRDEFRDRPGVLGRPIPGARVRSLDPDGAEVPPGEIGEFVVSAPWQAPGYWGNEDATRETFTVEGVRSGDHGRAEADGWLHFAGRSKDVIISGGENVFPLEVEGALRRLPWVADAVACGVPDEVWGERVEAAVVLRSGRTADPDRARLIRDTAGDWKARSLHHGSI